MNAVVLEAKDQLAYKKWPRIEATGDEVVVDMKASALNHRDVWISKGMYPEIQFPVILGSDGAGIYQGEPVILNPSVHWNENPTYQPKDFEIIGMPNNGTFAEQILVQKEQLFPMPKHLNFESASALPLAGLTAYRTLFTRCQLKKNERVLISGVGGGVALFAMQFAIAAGAEVYVTSGSDEKIEKAIRLGARGGVNYKVDFWYKKLQKLTSGFDVIVDSAGGEGFTNLLKVADFGARIGIYGGTRGNIPKVSPQLIFWKQISILGSTMGSTADFEQMLSFVNKNKITPIVDKIFYLSEYKLAFQYLEAGQQFGKIVMTNEC